jgi:hypothetical protein
LTVAKSSKILKGVDSIITYIGCGRQFFYDLVELGLPAAVIGGTWYAHADNIEEFFRRRTLMRVNQIPPNAE